MNKKMKLCLILIIFTLSASAGKYNTTFKIGDSMPEFSNLPAIDGSSLSSKDLTEDVVVLILMANQCSWVKGIDQEIIEMVDSFKDKSVKVVGFSVSQQEEDKLQAMQKHAEKVGYNFNYVYDESQDLGRQLGATRTPEYFVFDKLRKLVYMGTMHNSPARMNSDGSIEHINGEVYMNFLKEAVKSVLSVKQPDFQETKPYGCPAKYI